MAATIGQDGRYSRVTQIRLVSVVATHLGGMLSTQLASCTTDSLIHQRLE